MEFMDIVSCNTDVNIKVIGVGGGGGNAVDHMVRQSLSGVSFVSANTDIQALNRSVAEYKIQLGEKLTKGRGAGAKPEVGCNAAIESIDQIKEIIGDAEMVFITAGMGGGTGTGAAPVIARVAKELGALTVGVVTKPFTFEGKRRLQPAEAGIAEMHKYVDSLITIPNDRLVQLAQKKATFTEMLAKANDVLYQAVKGISDLLVFPGLINLDFADLQTVMSESGLALMGSGSAKGENRAKEAATRAITSPLLEDVDIKGARGVLVNITGNSDLGMDEINEAMSIIYDVADPDAYIIMGTVIDEEVGDEMSITVVATGIDSSDRQAAHAAGTHVINMRQPSPHPGQPVQQPQQGANADQSQARQAAYSRAPGGNLNVPTYKRVQDPNTGLNVKTGGHNPGANDFIFDDDFEIPSFMRKQAN